jgi:hypothetical protein
MYYVIVDGLTTMEEALRLEEAMRWNMCALEEKKCMLYSSVL